MERAWWKHYEELDLEMLLKRLEASPKERVPGKVKKLRGRLEGVLQYDLPDGNRAQWVVEDKTVTVLYVGRHP